MTNLTQERLEAREQLLGLRTVALRDARKALEDFNYSVAHDLRAPLRHISGYTEIVLEDYGSQLDPRCREHCENIQQSARQMAVMVDDLLQLSRLGLQELCLQPVALDALVQGVVQDLARETAEREVEWRIGPLPQVVCDAVMMKQAVLHLLANAVKFTRPRAHAVIEAGTIEENGVTTIFVRDNGAGFDMKYTKKLFGVFQRLHAQQEFEGVGSGLAITQRILQRHGGRIWAEAEVDKGATFYFTLDGIQALGR
jgi:light-regulated signal transduction histidine kinase (bacteriophytochrome)